MNKKAILAIVLTVFLAYANTLFNDFVGDDAVLFRGNDFYKNPQNLSRLIDKSFITRSDDIDPAVVSQFPSFSGCVSYRPVVALSFFTDYFFWKDNPAGHHLTNVILHIANAVLVYALAWHMTKNGVAAFLAGTLFGVHPINAEAVNSVGFRSDILSLGFVLWAFFCFIRLREKKHAGVKGFLPVYFFFLLSLLSKESAVVVPLILLAYDKYFGPKNENKESGWTHFKEHAGLWAVLIFYLYLYLVLFPNANAPGLYSHPFDILSRLKLMAVVWLNYAEVFFMPWRVAVLPPLYLPPLQTQFFLAFLLFAACVFIISKYHQTSKTVSFFTLWFLLAYLPTSNIILLPNPLAYRFMYFPSVGFFIICALLLAQCFVFLKEKIGLTLIPLLLSSLVIGLCLVVTIPYNMNFKNNYMAFSAMLRRYPDSVRPYFILGQYYFIRGNYDKALEYFDGYLKAKNNNPFAINPTEDHFVYHQRGLCYFDRPDLAIYEFEKAIALKPDYAVAYADMARAYILKNDFPRAIRYAEKAILKNPKLILGYIFAAHAYTMTGDFTKAEGLLSAALALSPDDPNLKYLQDFLKDKRSRKGR